MKRASSVYLGIAVISAMSLSGLALTGCDNYPGYPHNEQSPRADDNYKSGSGYYGGVTGQDQSKQTPGGPMSTNPMGSNGAGTSPGMMQTGNTGTNNAGGSTAGQTPNNGTAPTQDGGSH